MEWFPMGLMVMNGVPEEIVRVMLPAVATGTTAAIRKYTKYESLHCHLITFFSCKLNS